MIEALKRIPALAAVFSFLVAACEEAPSTREVFMATKGTVNFLKSAASRPPGLPVFVDADPFGDAQERSDQFADALGRATRQYAGLHFSGAGASEGVTVDRVVVVFDVPKGTTGLTICKGELVGGQPEDKEKLSFRAVMCRGADRLAEAEGRLPYRPSEAGDKGFVQIVDDAARILVRTEDQSPK